MEMPTKEQAIASNRDAWNDSARHHKDSADWQVLLSAVGRSDFTCLDDTLTAVLTEVGVDGKDVVQLGCNNGRESLSLFALGARQVVGVDQSAAFLDQARELTSRSPHEPAFIEADIHRLPLELRGRFDLALITIGVLNWMPDIGEFFRHVAQTLKPGGVLVVYETHPFLEMFDPESADPFALTSSYFRSEPFVQTEPIVYEGKVEQSDNGCRAHRAMPPGVPVSGARCLVQTGRWAGYERAGSTRPPRSPVTAAGSGG